MIYGIIRPMDELQFERYLLETHGLSLNPQQWEAVRHGDGPMLLLAVPGSGKTTVVVCRCAHLCLCRGVDPRRVLTLTFNKAAQRDMEARYEQLFGSLAPGARFSTIHSFCYGVLRDYGALVGRQVPRLMEEDKPRLLRGLYAEQNNGEYLTDDLLEELANRIGFVKNALWTDAQIEAGPHDIKGFPALFHGYERWKNENGRMDFDDMLDKALAAFKVRPQLLAAARQRYEHIHVDEAQDTSALQHEIIALIAAPRNNLALVGDEDQSIYLFRAANPQRLLDFRKFYPEGRVLRMETNYRSTGEIIRSAGALIGHNRGRYAKTMAGNRGGGAPVARTTLPDSADLCAHVVARLQAIPHAGGAAILYRENASAVPLMDALDRAGISFRVREHRLAFFEHWVVRDLLAMLRLAENPCDCAALRAVYYRLGAWITRAQMDDAEARAGACADVWEALLTCQGLRESAPERLRALRGKFQRLAKLPPGKAIAFALGDLGYADNLRRSAGKGWSGPTGPARPCARDGYFAESLLHRADSLRVIAERTGSFAELFERVAALGPLAERAAANRSRDAVTLSTVHSAKGLEFDAVIVVDLYEGRFPVARALAGDDKGDALEEERRLFYVAVTRARDTLELVSASRIHGERVQPSRFLKELLPPKSALDRAASALAGRRAAHPAAVVGLGLGAAVRHRSFGAGEVIGVSADDGLVQVRFAKYGVKTFDAAYSLSEGILTPQDAAGA